MESPALVELKRRINRLEQRLDTYEQSITAELNSLKRTLYALHGAMWVSVSLFIALIHHGIL